jgi:CHASE1-domain containing sensor protein
MNSSRLTSARPRLTDPVQLGDSSIPGRNPTPQQTSLVQRRLFVHGDDADVGEYGVLGKGRRAHKVLDGLALAGESRGLVRHETLALGRPDCKVERSDRDGKNQLNHDMKSAMARQGNDLPAPQRLVLPDLQNLHSRHSTQRPKQNFLDQLSHRLPSSEPPCPAYPVLSLL